MRMVGGGVEDACRRDHEGLEQFSIGDRSRGVRSLSLSVLAVLKAFSCIDVGLCLGVCRLEYNVGLLWSMRLLIWPTEVRSEGVGERKEELVGFDSTVLTLSEPVIVPLDPEQQAMRGTWPSSIKRHGQNMVFVVCRTTHS